jgi:hypothetical protein
VCVSEAETVRIWDLSLSVEESYFWESDSRLGSREIAISLWDFRYIDVNMLVAPLLSHLNPTNINILFL